MYHETVATKDLTMDQRIDNGLHVLAEKGYSVGVINTKILLMNDPCNCVVGQLVNDTFAIGIAMLREKSSDNLWDIERLEWVYRHGLDILSDSVAEQHGMIMSDGVYSYKALTAAWRARIEALRHTEK